MSEWLPDSQEAARGPEESLEVRAPRSPITVRWPCCRDFGPTAAARVDRDPLWPPLSLAHPASAAVRVPGRKSIVTKGSFQFFLAPVDCLRQAAEDSQEKFL